MEQKPPAIAVVIGLGNPGPPYYYNRHSIGFRVVDALANKYDGSWHIKGNMAIANIDVHGKKILLVKSQTFMNDSGAVIPALLKRGIKSNNILVIHDELELPFGTIKFKQGGSHRGHNGLRSIIAVCGPDFERLRFGIGRPTRKEDVNAYVIHDFSEDAAQVEHYIAQAVTMVEQLIAMQSKEE